MEPLFNLSELWQAARPQEPAVADGILPRGILESGRVLRRFGRRFDLACSIQHVVVGSAVERGRFVALWEAYEQRRAERAA